MKNILEKFINPSVKTLVIAYLVTVLCVVWTVVMLVIGPINLAVEIVSYVSYALAAIMLAYSIYTIVATKAVQKLVKWVKGKIRAHRITAKLLENYDYRTLFFSACSLTLTLAYAVYNGVIAVMGIMRVWHGALAAYYIYLVCMRFGVLFYRGKRHSGKVERVELIEARKFRNCGILLVVVIISLSAAIFQMVKSNAGFERHGMMIYVAAAYTFIKIGTSIANFVKARREDDYTLQTLRNVNLADAVVSVLALQTAMLREFGAELDVGIFNALTGAGVCSVILALGIYMIVKGNIGLKKLKEEEQLGE